MTASVEPAADGASGSDNRPEILTIEEAVAGSIWAEGVAVIIAPAATVIGNMYARQITVFGTVSGTLEASGRVDLREGCRGTGRVFAATLVAADGASFTGTATRAEPPQPPALLGGVPNPVNTE